MKDVPELQKQRVIAKLFADAEDLDWEHLSLAGRSAAYTRWVTDPDVGGVLARYVTAERARSWIKDGPMKEFHRARRGTGRYARFGPADGTGPEEVVRAALGEGWTLLGGSVGTKPSHCLAVSGAEDTNSAYLAWGPPSAFRHVLWAALRHAVDHDGRAVAVVVTGPTDVVADDDAKLHRRLADRCGLEVAYVTERLGTTAPAGPPR